MMISLLSGTNAYKRLAELKEIAREHSADTIERRDGEDLSPEVLRELLQGVTLFSPEKLVIIRDLSKNKPLWGSLSEQLDDIPQETHLVLIEESPDKRTRTFKQLQKKANVIVCEELPDSHVIDWLVSEAKERADVTLDRRAASHLLQRVGNNQSRLSGELDKLVVLSEPITPEVIDGTVEATPEGNAFELLDAALARRSAQVRRHIANVRFTEDPYRLFGLLTSQVFTLALVYAGKAMASEELAKQASVHPFVVRKLGPLARSMNDAEITYIAHEVAALDDRMKSSGGDTWDLLEHTLLKISTR